MLDLKGNRVTYFGHSTFSLTTSSGQSIDRPMGHDESDVPEN